MKELNTITNSSKYQCVVGRCTGGGEASHCSVQCHRGYSVTVLNGRVTPPNQVKWMLVEIHPSIHPYVYCLSMQGPYNALQILSYGPSSPKSRITQKHLQWGNQTEFMFCLLKKFKDRIFLMLRVKAQTRTWVKSHLSFVFLFLFPPQRKTELECFHGSWDRVVTCQPVDCGLPDQSHVYHAIFSCPWGTTFGKQCSFTCGSPAILQGKGRELCLFYCILL